MSDEQTVKNNLRSKLHSLNCTTTYDKVDKLEVGKQYNVIDFCLINTRYGSRLCVNLEDSPHVSIRIILPNRFQDLQSDIDQLNSTLRSGERATFTYFGTTGLTTEVKLGFAL